MPEFGTWLLANIFTALLPPLNDADDRDYYEILGVPRDATNEKIRKAYKVQSLKLHPDKVAQRRETNAEEAAKQYELVQEAYGVLVNDQKRQRYHALQCSPKRFRFVNQGALANPGALYENLTTASTMDKTRLVVLCTLIVVVLFIQPILIACKVNQIVEEDGGGLESTKWITLLIPTWFIGVIWILFYLLLLALAPMEAKVTVFLSLVENILWYFGAILLALKWDNTLSSSYGQILIPVYLAMVLRWMSQAFLLLTIRRDVARMVTVDYLEKDVLQGKSLEDMSEEEQEKLRKTYLVVTVPPDFEPLELEEPAVQEGGEPVNKDEFLEAQKVEASPEYDAAMDIYFTTLGGLVGSLVFGLVFLILLTLKLDRKIDASYWIVFIPVWIHYGSRWTYYCYRCACGTVSGDEIMLHMQHHVEEEEKKDGDEEVGGGGEVPEMPKNDRPKDDDFVDPSSSFGKFNADEESAKPAEEGDSSMITKQASGDKTSESKEDTPTVAPTKDEKNSSIPVVDDKQEEKAHDKEGDGEVKKEGTDDENIHIDEETFHAWQNAYEEAERGAMEEQAKASAECCNLSVQLMVIIMVVAKIEDTYWDNDDPSDPGFNTFWILFPFFLFFGLVLCCCACLIYGAEPGKASDLQESENAEEATGSQPIDEAAVVLPPPPAEETNAEPAAAAAQPPKNESPAEPKDVESGVQKEQPVDTTEIDEID